MSSGPRGAGQLKRDLRAGEKWDSTNTITMINRETPLTKIIGQMSWSKSTDVSIKSRVFISVKHDLTKLARWFHTHKTAGINGG